MRGLVRIQLVFTIILAISGNFKGGTLTRGTIFACHTGWRYGDALAPPLCHTTADKHCTSWCGIPPLLFPPPKLPTKNLQFVRQYAPRLYQGRNTSTVVFFFLGVWGSNLYTPSGPLVYTLFLNFPKQSYTPWPFALCDLGVWRETERGGCHNGGLHSLFCPVYCCAFLPQGGGIERIGGTSPNREIARLKPLPV